MKRPVGRLLGLVGFGALASQAGHLLVYQLQFGSAAATIQSHGAHAYFPLFAKTGLGIAALVLVCGAMIIGAARLASGQRISTISSPPYMNLLSSLFTVQLAFFVIQETVESLVAGTPAPHVVALVFLGTVGQLPVAAAAALAIKWLAARLDTAVISLQVVVTTPPVVALPAVVLTPRPQLILQAALAEACPASFVKRGPPEILRG